MQTRTPRREEARRLRVGPGLSRSRLSIHETADVSAATAWWSDVVGVSANCFRRATLKTHKPSTVRRNVEDSYRGCLIVYVPKSSRLYWEVEGVMGGIAAGGDRWRAARM